MSGRASSEVLSDVQLVCMGGCTRIFWIRFRGACQAGCCPRYRPMFNWWCVWVSVRRFVGLVGGVSGRVPFEVSYDVQLVVYGRVYADLLDSLWGAASFFNVMMQRFYFVFAAALLQKEDLVMLSMQKMKFTVYEKIAYSISLQHLDS